MKLEKIKKCLTKQKRCGNIKESLKEQTEIKQNDKQITGELMNVSYTALMKFEEKFW